MPGEIELANKENIPAECTLVGDPLKVSFLTIEKLDEYAQKQGAGHNYVASVLTKIDRNSLDTHLIPSFEASELVNSLSQENFLEETLSSLGIFILADASTCQNLLLAGQQRNSKTLTTYKATYLGSLKSAIKELHHLSSQLQSILQLRKCVCRCRLDVLKDFIISEKATDFGERAVKKVDGSNLSNLLEMPPDSATAVVKFSPGWMDERVALTDRIQELKYLTKLSTALNAGEIPWIKEQDSAFLLENVAQLINGAKNCLDTMAKNIKTVQQAFQMIYDAMRTGEFRVLVELEPFACLQMLVEIGVDRFHGDLAYRYMKQEFLPNATDLDPFLLHNSANLDERIERLIPIHLALQSIIMINQFVQLAPHEKVDKAKQLLAHFATAKSADLYNKEFSFEVCMEDINRDKLKNNMSEWLLQRTYEKPAINGRIGCSAPINEVIHISKGTGFKHVAPVQVQDTISSSPAKLFMNTTMNGQKTADEVEVDNDSNQEMCEEELFDCVYLLASSNPTAVLPNK
uniref:Uncharacterized protein n=1 Tax=Ditylenchus dipsaci TaxID=166011 RepID=A0A915D5X0_9BILA